MVLGDIGGPAEVVARVAEFLDSRVAQQKLQQRCKVRFPTCGFLYLVAELRDSPHTRLEGSRRLPAATELAQSSLGSSRAHRRGSGKSEEARKAVRGQGEAGEESGARVQEGHREQGEQGERWTSRSISGGTLCAPCRKAAHFSRSTGAGIPSSAGHCGGPRQ